MEEEYGYVPQKCRHRALAITSVILGIVSCFCCLGSGFGIVPAVIAVVFGIIAVAKGGSQARKLGLIGLITSVVGLILNVIILAYGIWMINWDQLTMENLSGINNIDPNNEQEVINWLQQFVKIDLSSLLQ